MSIRTPLAARADLVRWTEYGNDAFSEPAPAVHGRTKANQTILQLLLDQRG